MQIVFLSFLLLLTTESSFATLTPRRIDLSTKKCVQIYYDRRAVEDYKFGRMHAVYLQNLLGHFANVQQIISPIEKYKEGDIEKCAASIYLGTHFLSEIPPSFYSDFVETKKQVLWAGYNVWKFKPIDLEKMWGVTYKGLSKLDTDHLDEQGKPQFFKNFSYKGEEFEKYGNWDFTDRSRFNAAFEMVLFDFKNPEFKKNVLSWSTHSYSQIKYPYLIRNENHWYIADSPFSFATEDDRYLIFADLLFDLLNEEPLYNGKKPAIFRIEDVLSDQINLPLWMLFQIVDTIKEYKIPFHISLIPVFSDPYGNVGAGNTGGMIPFTQKPNFVDFLKYSIQNRGEMILHGISHQSGMYLNPTGRSGDDFEFWDIINNRPLPEDSLKYVLDRLDFGYELLELAQIKNISAWLTPHYQASPFDSFIFGQVFDWIIGRVIYFPDIKVTQEKRLPEEFNYLNSGSSHSSERYRYLKDLEVSYSQSSKPNGQFFPYEIYGDIYEQNVIPENLGNVQPYYIPGVLKVRSTDDIIKTMKRNRVLRDSWASLFFHPFLLGSYGRGGVSMTPGDVSQVRRLIETALENGYEFISINEWKNLNKIRKKPSPIEIY